MSLNFKIDATLFSPKRLLGRFRGDRVMGLGMFRPNYPPLAVEVGDEGLTLVHVERGKKKHVSVRRFGPVELPAGALSVQFSRPNLLRPADVAGALKAALEGLEIEAQEISLVLPDHLARVSLIRLGERPTSRKEALELIRWKLRKAVPFKVEDAHIDYQVVAVPGEETGVLCLATLVLRSVLEQYEDMLQSIGLHAGLIDLSTFNLVNLYLPVLGETDTDAFILNVSGSFFALMIVRGGTPVFYRAKSYAFAGSSTGDARRDLIVREVGTSLTYYSERLLGGELNRFYMRCIGLDLEGFRRTLQGRLGFDVEIIDPSRIVEIDTGDRDSAGRGAALQRIAPALGAALGRES